MSDHIIFHLVFLSQVLLISFYYPKKIRDRMAYLFRTYPPATHPKLYPGPIGSHESIRRTYWILNSIILLAGLMIFGALLRVPHDNDVHNAIAIGYFFAQFLPLLLLDLSALKQFKLMRYANSRRTRKADLNPRRLFDFVSPLIVGAAVATYIAFIFFIVYIRQFNFPWFGGYLNVVGISLMNLFFAGIIVFSLYGRKLNPHQAREDRAKQIEVTVKTLVFTSITATLFVSLDVGLSALEMRQLLPVTLSLYLQLIAVISFQTYRIEFSNFDVYKEDPLVT